MSEETNKAESTPSQSQELSGTISNRLNIQEFLPSLPTRRIDRRRLLDDDERDLDNIPIDPIYSQSTETAPKSSVNEDDSEEYVPVKKRKNLQVRYNFFKCLIGTSSKTILGVKNFLLSKFFIFSFLWNPCVIDVADSGSGLGFLDKALISEAFAFYHLEHNNKILVRVHFT